MKPKLLYYGDSPTCDTGFGVVAQNILPLLATKYDITVVGINDLLPYKDPALYPYKVYSPVIYGEPTGKGLFVKLLRSQKWDYVFMFNDIDYMAALQSVIYEEREKQKFKFVLYTPIDTDYIPMSYFATAVTADKLVLYVDKYVQLLEQAYPTMAKRITYIHHGSEVVDTLPSKNHKKKLKKELFGLEPEQTLFTFVGRFQWRKNVPALIAGFKLAWLQNPNIRLYLHSGNQDMGGDLKQTVFYVKPPTMSDTDNLKAMKAIIFTPDSFSVNNSLSRDALNMVYQASDAFVTTTLGEGWGLPITEAMANGTPVIAPKFSAITEIIGDNAERGNYWTDSVDYNQDVYYPIPSSKGGYVHTRPEDVATKLLDFVTNKKDHLSKISAAHQWTQQRQWPMIAKQWLDLFSQL